MTSAGGGERLDNKSPPPLPHWREFQKLPPPHPTQPRIKNANLKCVFLKKYMDDFLV
jgi:hypothetical protein